MNKLAIRKRGGHSYELGPTNGSPGTGRTVMVTANGKREALATGLPLWKEKYDTRPTRSGA